MDCLYKFIASKHYAINKHTGTDMADAHIHNKIHNKLLTCGDEGQVMSTSNNSRKLITIEPFNFFSSSLLSVPIKTRLY